MNKKKSTSVSIDKKILAKAQNKINALFAGNTSAYVNYLMGKDTEDIKEEKTEEKAQEKDILDDKKKAALDKMMNDED